MLKLKALLAKILDWITTTKTRLNRPIVRTSFSSKSVPSGAYTSLAKITLPANGTYIVFAVVNCGATSGTFSGGYYSVRTSVSSGTATVSYNGQGKAFAAAGGGITISGLYATGSSSITVSADMYLYGTMTTSGANGTIWAVPVVNGV